MTQSCGHLRCQNAIDGLSVGWLIRERRHGVTYPKSYITKLKTHTKIIYTFAEMKVLARCGGREQPVNATRKEIYYTNAILHYKSDPIV